MVVETYRTKTKKNGVSRVIVFRIFLINLLYFMKEKHDSLDTQKCLLECDIFLSNHLQNLKYKRSLSCEKQVKEQ